MTTAPDGRELRDAALIPPAEYRDRPESPCSPDWERAFEPRYAAHYGEHKRNIVYMAASSSTLNPETPMQALMEAPPFEEPSTSLAESSHLRERLADAIDGLEPRLRWIFEARYFRGLSVREVGRELNLSKSFVDRLYKQAVESLQVVLADLMEEQ